MISYEEQVRGRRVVDARGRSIGEVDAIFLDSESIGRGLAVSALRIKLDAEVADDQGISRGTFRAGVVDVPAQAIQALGDAVILNVTIESLVRLPTSQPEVH